jgi:hypothetical protein
MLMAFTDISELYGAINEKGINQIVQHLMRLRPSLFNYGTEAIANNLKLLCNQIDADPMVFARNNPLITIESPIPVLGTEGLVNLNYCVQLTEVRIDFHPGNTISLPPELGVLPQQRFALFAKTCIGLGCPDVEYMQVLENALGQLYAPIFVDDYVNSKPNDTSGTTTHNTDKPPRHPPPVVVPTRKLTCFCMEVYAIGHFEVTKVNGRFLIKPKLDGLEIVDLRPQEMEDMIECYVSSVIRLGLLPRIQIALEKIVLDQLKIVTVILKPSATVPNNPAIEQDELRVFIDMEVA